MTVYLLQQFKTVLFWGIIASASIAACSSIIKRKKRQANSKMDHRQTLQGEIGSSSTLPVKPIGRVESIYRLCVGTPRQGLLAPHARGRIVLDGIGNFGSAQECVKGLEEYSHIWIIFIFHLNTTAKGNKKVSKIAPPALGGQKVGVLATRSPHRHNPIGITLAKLDRIRTIPGIKKKMEVCLDISGLDLIDGTPVLDIKPFVSTYDSPSPETTNLANVSVPHWVSSGLATKRSVTLESSARVTLKELIQREKLDFYGKDESTEEALENVVLCIEEVLAIDVRSGYQTKKARQGRSNAERSDRLRDTKGAEPAARNTQQIDNLLVYFDVRAIGRPSSSSSEGSGAEDCVVVTGVTCLERKAGVTKNYGSCLDMPSWVTNKLSPHLLVIS